MALKVEGVVDRSMDAKEALGGSNRLEPLHRHCQLNGVEVSFRSMPSQPPRDHRSEFEHPAPYRFVGNVEPTLGEEVLNVSIAQREAQVEPHTACWMTTGGKRWRRYEISTIAPAYPRPHSPASQLT
jgi:hypothetical protein